MLQSIDSNFLDEPMEHIIKIYLTRVSAFYFLLLQTLPQKEKKKKHNRNPRYCWCYPKNLHGHRHKRLDDCLQSARNGIGSNVHGIMSPRFVINKTSQPDYFGVFR